MHPNYWKFKNRNVQTFRFVYQDTNDPNHGPVWKSQSFLLSGICTVILWLWQDYYRKGNWRKSFAARLGKGFQLGILNRAPSKKGCSYLCIRMTSNWLDRNKTLIQCGKYSTKKLIRGNQHLSWITNTWAALNDNVKQAKILWTITESCLIREFPVEGVWENWKLRYSEDFVFLLGLMIKKVVRRNVWRYCDLANKTTQQLNKVSVPCIDDLHLKKKEIKFVGELSQVCSRIVLKYWNLVRIGRSDILWSMEKLTRSITKWT